MVNHHDAEEAVQNAWVSIFKALIKYKHDGRFEAWIKVIVIREAWSLRSKKKQVEFISEFDNLLGFEIEEDIIGKMSCQEILKKLENVPVGSREVFKMYVLDGYKHVEIAKILGISVSTSRVHLSKARKALKIIIENTTYLTR